MRKPAALVTLLAWLILLGLTRASDPSARATPDEAIHRLTDGNVRFSEGRSARPRGNLTRAAETARDGQHPFAAILSCSDSRVPLEIVFDQGIGDIFVVRVVGNVCGVNETGSIEYAVEHLGIPLLVVLGHTQCGAVKTVVTGAEAHGNIKSLVEKIALAVSKAQAEHLDLHGNDLVPAATEANVWRSVEDLLKTSPTMRHSVQSGKLKVVGAIYDVKSGQVKWLGEHRQQSQLLRGDQR